MNFSFTWKAEEVQAELERRARIVAKDAAVFMLETYQSLASVKTAYMVKSASVVEAPEGSRFSFYVVVAAPYAEWVEFGHTTSTGRWVPPNPALRIALKQTMAAFPAIAEKAKTRGFGTYSPVVAGFTK